MKWKFWIQEKLYCTSQEVNLLLGLIAIILTSHGIQIYRAGVIPFDDAYYAQTDSLFRYLAARADSLEAVDTVFTGSSYSRYPLFDSTLVSNKSEGENAIRTASLTYPTETSAFIHELSRWIVRDTVEKPSVTFPLNINTATESELQALPRIGPQMARRIIEYRRGNRFGDIEQLTEVRGIGAKTMDQLRPLVTVMVKADTLQVELEPQRADSLR